MTGHAVTLTLDADEVADVVEALRADASRRQRAVTRAAAELEAEHRAGQVTDVRPSAVRIARALAQAARLEAVAGQLEAAYETARAAAVKASTNGRRPAGEPPSSSSPAPPADGTSDEDTPPDVDDDRDAADPATKAAEKKAGRRTVASARAEAARAADLALRYAEPEDEPTDDDLADALSTVDDEPEE